MSVQGRCDYKCKFCDEPIKDSYHKKIHERQHTKEYPHKCRYCSKAFVQKSHKNEHENLHISKPHTTWSSYEVWHTIVPENVAIALLELKK